MTAAGGYLAITTGTITDAVLAATIMLLAVVMGATETSGTTMAEMVVAVAMVLLVVVVTGIVATMREGVVSPLGTTPGTRPCHPSNNSQAYTSLDLFHDHRRRRPLAILWCHSLLCHMFRTLHTLLMCKAILSISHLWSSSRTCTLSGHKCSHYGFPRINRIFKRISARR